MERAKSTLYETCLNSGKGKWFRDKKKEGSQRAYYFCEGFNFGCKEINEEDSFNMREFSPNINPRLTQISSSSFGDFEQISRFRVPIKYSLLNLLLK